MGFAKIIIVGSKQALAINQEITICHREDCGKYIIWKVEH